MLNNKGPLMFINTVNTQIEDASEQKIFDSRDNNPKKVNSTNSNIENQSIVNREEDYSIEPKFIEERKIKNIIEMYHKERPVLCNIISKDYEIIGVPFKLDNSLLCIKTSEDKSKTINVDEITDIIIIKF